MLETIISIVITLCYFWLFKATLGLRKPKEKDDDYES